MSKPTKAEDLAVVLQALRNAVANGYVNVVTDLAEDVATDLATYDSEIEKWEMERILPLVKESQCVLRLEADLGSAGASGASG